MNYLYKTVAKPARSEITIEKSKFITTVIPCESKEEAEVFFNKIRTEFKDATHNVPAFIVGNKMELKWASDDGEPQGTAGPPILRYLEHKELTNVAIVVTRYFGGIKLGTGGLVRAYTESAESAVEEAGTAGAILVKKASVTADYSDYNRIINYKFPDSINETLKIGEAVFTDKVQLDVSCGVEAFDSLVNILKDLSSGSVNVEVIGEKILDKICSLL